MAAHKREGVYVCIRLLFFLNLNGAIILGREMAFSSSM